MRRQIQDFEDRVARQINKLENQLADGGAPQSVLARLEGKVSSAEASVPKLDRRVAEVNGTVKGLSEEMQSQIRKVNGLEEWVFSAHQQLQTELGTKLVEFEQVLQKVASTRRAVDSGSEDAVKRLAARVARLEHDAQARWSSGEDMRGTVNSLCSRLDALEDRCLAEAATRLEFATPLGGTKFPVEPMAQDGDAHDGTSGPAALAAMRKRLGDVVEQTERVFQDMHDVHARVAEQKVELGTLRTLFDSRVEHIKQIGDKLSRTTVWESKLQALQSALEEASSRSSTQQEELEALSRRVQEGLPDEADRRTEDGTLREASEAARAAMESRVESLSLEVSRLAEEASIVPQVNVLVSQLKDMVPQVVSHDQRIKEFVRKAQEDRARDGAAIAERFLGLEASVSLLKDVVPSVANHDKLIKDITHRSTESGEDVKEVVERCAALESAVSSLKEVAPQVASHDQLINDLAQRSQELEREKGEVLDRYAALESAVSSLKEVVPQVGNHDKLIMSLAQRSQDDGRQAEAVAEKLGKIASSVSRSEAVVEKLGSLESSVTSLQEALPQVVSHVKELAQRMQERGRESEEFSEKLGTVGATVTQLSAKVAAAVAEFSDGAMRAEVALLSAAVAAAVAGVDEKVQRLVQDHQDSAAGSRAAAEAAESTEVFRRELQDLRQRSMAELQDVRSLAERQASHVAAATTQATDAEAKALVAEVKIQELQGRLWHIQEGEEEARKNLGEQLEESMSRLEKDVEALREAVAGRGAVADAAPRQELEALRSSIAVVSSSAKDQCSRLESELETAIGLVREGVARYADQSDMTMQTVQDTHSELQALRSEVQAAVAERATDAATLATLRRDLASALAGEHQDAWAADAAHLRADVAALQQRLAAAEASAPAPGAAAGDLAVLKSSADSLAVELAGLRGDVAAVHQRLAGCESAALPPGDLDLLRRGVAASAEQLSALLADVAALSALRADVAALQQRPPAAADAVEPGGAGDEALDGSLWGYFAVAMLRRQGRRSEAPADELRSMLTAWRSAAGRSRLLAELEERQAELEERQVDQLLALKGEVAQLLALKGEVAELRRGSEESRLEERWSLSIQDLTRELQALRDTTELSRRSGSDDLAVLRQEMSAFQGYSATPTDVEAQLGSVVHSVAEFRRSGEQIQTQLESLSGHLATLQAAAAAVEPLARDVAELKERGTTALERSTSELGRLQVELDGLQRELSALSSRQAAAAPANGSAPPGAAARVSLVRAALAGGAAVGGTAERGAGEVAGAGAAAASDADVAEQLRQLADLAAEAQEDDAREEASHRQLLVRIDELCERLAELDAAVAGGGGGKVAGQPLSLDEELRRRFEGLVTQEQLKERTCSSSPLGSPTRAALQENPLSSPARSSSGMRAMASE